MSAAHDLDGLIRFILRDEFWGERLAAVRPAAHEEEDLRIGWTEENAAAIAERRSWIRAKGTPLADLQVLKLD